MDNNIPIHNIPIHKSSSDTLLNIVDKSPQIKERIINDKIAERENNRKNIWRSCCFHTDSRFVIFLTQYFIIISTIVFSINRIIIFLIPHWVWKIIPNIIVHNRNVLSKFIFHMKQPCPKSWICINQNAFNGIMID